MATLHEAPVLTRGQLIEVAAVEHTCPLCKAAPGESYTRYRGTGRGTLSKPGGVAHNLHHQRVALGRATLSEIEGEANADVHARGLPVRRGRPAGLRPEVLALHDHH